MRCLCVPVCEAKENMRGAPRTRPFTSLGAAALFAYRAAEIVYRGVVFVPRMCFILQSQKTFDPVAEEMLGLLFVCAFCRAC